MNEIPGLFQHKKTKVYWFRRRIPRDLQSYYKKTEHKITLRTKVESEAEILAIKEYRETSERWETVRQRRTPQNEFTERDAEAIAGELYRMFIKHHRNAPQLAEFYEFCGQLLDDAYRSSLDPDEGPTWYIVQQSSGRYVHSVMQRHGFPLKFDHMPLVYFRVAKALAAACRYMIDYVKGRVVEDVHDKPFPPLLVKRNGFEKTFQMYIAEKSLSTNTVKRWRPVIDSLLIHVGHDNLDLIHRTDVAAWLYDLRRSGRNPVTIRNVYLGSAKSLFGWLHDSQMIEQNPTVGHRVHGKGPVRTRTKKSLYLDEARIILRATLHDQGLGIDRYEAAARRWIPWLCAYTGARVNELTQLRRCDVFKLEGVYAIHITPTAGSVKSRQARDVPLHSHLLDQGFLDFVRGSSDGPLFHEPEPDLPPPGKRARGGRSGAAAPTRPNARLSARLASWIRSLGVTDPEVAPNHGWRHRFNTMARKVRMDREKRDAIKGHAPASVAESYGEFDLDDLRDEIEKLPRYDLDAADPEEKDEDDLFLNNAPTRRRKAA